jgi:hypothetical protein
VSLGPGRTRGAAGPAGLGRERGGCPGAGRACRRACTGPAGRGHHGRGARPGPVQRGGVRQRPGENNAPPARQHAAARLGAHRERAVPSPGTPGRRGAAPALRAAGRRRTGGTGARGVGVRVGGHRLRRHLHGTGGRARTGRGVRVPDRRQAPTSPRGHPGDLREPADRGRGDRLLPHQRARTGRPARPRAATGNGEPRGPQLLQHAPLAALRRERRAPAVEGEERGEVPARADHRTPAGRLPPGAVARIGRYARQAPQRRAARRAATRHDRPHDRVRGPGRRRARPHAHQPHPAADHPARPRSVPGQGPGHAVCRTVAGRHVPPSVRVFLGSFIACRLPVAGGGLGGSVGGCRSLAGGRGSRAAGRVRAGRR